MFFDFFKVIKKNFLGVDIGISSIKIIELSRWGKKIEVVNYGHVASSALYQKPYQGFERESSFMISSPDVSKIIKAILKEAGIKTKEAVFSIPDFSTFFTSFTLPPMSREEIPDAVKFEARRHIPVPISEVVLDWFLLGGETGKKGTPLEVLLVAVPQDTIKSYQEIASNSSLELKYLEAEGFSLARALVREKKDTVCLVDLGAQSTSITVVEEGKIQISYSSDVSGNDFTHAISRSLSVDFKKAEEMKKIYGIVSSDTKTILLPLVNLIIIEIEKIFRSFEKADKRIGKIILAGGSALLPGLQDYLSSYFKRPVQIANPFYKFIYPSLLEKRMRELGPSFAIAVGAAMRGLEK
ncbi:type IV pilus assembly protein PilM [bacterium]|nr:type IV pilus assembly protein PilM [bacterium]